MRITTGTASSSGSTTTETSVRSISNRSVLVQQRVAPLFGIYCSGNRSGRSKLSLKNETHEPVLALPCVPRLLWCAPPEAITPRPPLSFITAERESGGDTWALERSVSRSRRHRPEAASSVVSLALPALPTASRNRPVSAARSSGPVCCRYSCKCAACLWECARTPLARPSASARRAILRTHHPAPRTTRPPAGECAATLKPQCSKEVLNRSHQSPAI